MLAEALGRSGVKSFLELEVDPKTLTIKSYNKENLALVLNDLYGPKTSRKSVRDSTARKVHETRDLSLYSSVLASEKARSVLHSGKDLEDAAIYTGTREQSLTLLDKRVRALKLLLVKVAPNNPRDPSVAALHEKYKQFEVAVKEFLKNA